MLTIGYVIKNSGASSPWKENLKSEGLIDNYIKFDFEYKEIDKTKAYRYYSNLRRKKETLGVRDVRKHNCSHIMLMDADEFYINDEFKRPKSLSMKRRLHIAFAPYMIIEQSQSIENEMRVIIAYLLY